MHSDVQFTRKWRKIIANVEYAKVFPICFEKFERNRKNLPLKTQQRNLKKVKDNCVFVRKQKS
jgi:hypothetical protein